MGRPAHPNLAPHVHAGGVHVENQKAGTTAWQSKELAHGRGQDLVEDDEPGDGPSKSAPRRANADPGATAYEAADASTCGTNCWTDQTIRGYTSASSINKGQGIQI